VTDLVVKRKCAAADCTLAATTQAIYQLRNADRQFRNVHEFWAWVDLCPSHAPEIPPICDGMDLRSVIRPIEDDDDEEADGV